MHCASAALRDTATEFCAGQTDHVTQHPEKRGIGLDVDLPGCSVNVDRDHCGSLPALRNNLVRTAKIDCDQAGNAFAAAPTAGDASGRSLEATRANTLRS